MSETKRFSPLDGYARRARLFPALLVLLPLGLCGLAWAPAGHLGWAALVSLITTVGVSYLLAELGRDAGRRKERALVARWNGLPSVRLLRHRDNLSNTETLRRYHRALESLIPGLILPTLEEELVAPANADRVYESCSQFLRERTRDKGQFGLLFEENTSYGFRRNLWAMKAAGSTIAALGLIGSALGAWRAYLADTGRFDVAALAVLGCAYLLVMWTVRVRLPWVEDAAMSYGERLLSACEVLRPDSPSVARDGIRLPREG